MAILEVEHIKKKFGKTDVLKDISFSLEQGEVLSIIGSSGPSALMTRLWYHRIIRKWKDNTSSLSELSGDAGQWSYPCK